MSRVARLSPSWRWPTVTAGMAVSLLLAACAGAPAVAPTPPPTPASPVATAAVALASPAPTAGLAPSPSPSAAAIKPKPTPIGPAKPEAALAPLWTAHGPDAARPWIWSPEIDPHGRIWAASSYDDAFWIVDRDGKYVESWGGNGSGSGDGEFRFVADGSGFGDVAFRPDGGFYVADAGNARIQQFTADREFVRSFGTFGTGPGQLTIPIDIDVDGAGNVYVTDDGRIDIQVFSPDGDYLRVAAADVGPYVAVDAHGTMYAVDNADRILYRFTPKGEIDLAVDLKPLVQFATGLDIAPSGDLFMTTSGYGTEDPSYQQLLQLDPDGKLKHVWPNGAESVAVDPAGDRVYQTGADVAPDVRAFELPAD